MGFFSSPESRAIAEVYASFGMHTTDEIAATASHRSEFVNRYRAMTGDTVHTEDEIIRRLFNLRKDKRLVAKYKGIQNN